MRYLMAPSGNRETGNLSDRRASELIDGDECPEVANISCSGEQMPGVLKRVGFHARNATYSARLSSVTCRADYCLDLAIRGAHNEASTEMCAAAIADPFLGTSYPVCKRSLIATYAARGLSHLQPTPQAVIGHLSRT